MKKLSATEAFRKNVHIVNVDGSKPEIEVIPDRILAIRPIEPAVPGANVANPGFRYVFVFLGNGREEFAKDFEARVLSYYSGDDNAILPFTVQEFSGAVSLVLGDGSKNTPNYTLKERAEITAADPITVVVRGAFPSAEAFGTSLSTAIHHEVPSKLPQLPRFVSPYDVRMFACHSLTATGNLLSAVAQQLHDAPNVPKALRDIPAKYIAPIARAITQKR